MYWVLDNLLYAIHPVVWFLAWAVFAFVQGVTMTGLWVLAHECGHGAFTDYEWLNDLVGYVVHTMLYVPYFPWKYTHASHHHYTNNIDRDEVWVPPVADDNQVQKELLTKRNTTIIGNIFVAARFTSVVLFGWPIYLLTNATAHKTNNFVNHFMYSDELFKGKPQWKIHISTIGLIAWTAALIYLGSIIGGWMLVRLYLLPLLVTNFFLVTITFMQHSEPGVAHYSNSEWNWLLGALCTVDRTMGPWLDRKLHLIHVTHVCHHLFSYIPFYHSDEVTKAIKPILGEYYLKSDRNYFLALWDNFKHCDTLENNKNGVYHWLSSK
jgi:omega-6 fatty acid desaturase (delta-12 desaturase)